MSDREGLFSNQGREYSFETKLSFFLLVRDAVETGMAIKPAISKVVDELHADFGLRPNRADRRNAIERAHRNFYDWREAMVLESDEEQIIRYDFENQDLNDEQYKIVEIEFRERGSVRGVQGPIVPATPSAVVPPRGKRGRPKKRAA